VRGFLGNHPTARENLEPRRRHARFERVQTIESWVESSGHDRQRINDRSPASFCDASDVARGVGS
jgi:hypothetical protein